jgi:Autotransporter beta-domain
MPTVGGFIGYSKNTDGTGLNAKVSISFNTGNVAITRDSSLDNTEPGYGKTRLTSHQVSGEASWGLRLSDSSTASPFVGIRHSDASRKGYKENTVIDTVESPITYNDYTQRSVTGTSGIRFKGSIFDRIGYQLALGVEHDINRQFTSYSGTSDIDGLTTFSLSNSGPSKRTRGFGSAGIHYQIEKNQRFEHHGTPPRHTPQPRESHCHHAAKIVFRNNQQSDVSSALPIVPRRPRRQSPACEFFKVVIAKCRTYVTCLQHLSADNASHQSCS